MSAEHEATPGAGSAATCALPGDERLLRLPAVLNKVGLGRTAVLDRVKRGDFPAPVKIGRATLWREAEVSAWVIAQVRTHREGR